MINPRLLWMTTLFCYSTQPQEVLAGKRELGPKKLADWKWSAGTQGPGVAMWDDHKRGTILATEVCPNCSSWFITPLVNTPNMSYVAIGAECDPYPCQLQLYGTSDGYNYSSPYSKNFEFIQNVAFETPSLKNITIENSYLRLRILARPSTKKTMFAINSISLFYYFCETATKYNANLSEVNSSTTNIKNEAQCVDNSVTKDGKSTNITVVCTPKGKWIVENQGCVCDKGFYSNHQGCSGCRIHYYKSVIGNTNCKKCPEGKTDNTAHTKCECKKDHYIGIYKDSKCYAIPPAVENIFVKSLTRTSVNVTWRKPKIHDGFEAPFTFTVECYHCINVFKCDTTVENAKFFPAKTNLDTTYVVVTGLTFNKKYKFKVISISNWFKNVSSDKWMFRYADFTISASLPESQGTSRSSPTPYFVGSTLTFSMVFVMFIATLVIYKRRRRTSKISTPAHTDEMPNQLTTEIWQNNQASHYENPDELIYETPNDGGTERYEEVPNLPPSVYTELNNNRQEGETTNGNNYQELLVHDSGYLNPVEVEIVPYENTDFLLPVYTKLNKVRRDETTGNNYQKLVKHSSDSSVIPAHADAETSDEVVDDTKSPPGYQDLDITKPEQDPNASYQKLIKQC